MSDRDVFFCMNCWRMVAVVDVVVDSGEDDPELSVEKCLPCVLDAVAALDSDDYCPDCGGRDWRACRCCPPLNDGVVVSLFGDIEFPEFELDAGLYEEFRAREMAYRAEYQDVCD